MDNIAEYEIFVSFHLPKVFRWNFAKTKRNMSSLKLTGGEILNRIAPSSYFLNGDFFFVFADSFKFVDTLDKSQFFVSLPENIKSLEVWQCVVVFIE